MTTIIPLNDIRGRIDFVILTIRDDEYLAVLDRFLPRNPVSGGKQVYEYCEVTNDADEQVSFAVVRMLGQGQSEAQAAAVMAIIDLAPSWLILCGIAGGVPDSEYTLGDVLLASRLIDLSVMAAIQDEGFEYRTGGGPMHRDVERLLAALPGWKGRLGDWNSVANLGLNKPTINVPTAWNDECFYGPEPFKRKVRAILNTHFPVGELPRAPDFRCDVLATSNVLVKEYGMLHEWKRVARQISHIEMEAGGVYLAARTAGDVEIPLLGVRGLSDIVGYRRSAEWTAFACHTAAAFVRRLVQVVPREIWGNSLRSLSDAVAQPGIAVDSQSLLQTATTEQELSQVEPLTVEDLIAAIRQSSCVLTDLEVAADHRIDRSEEQEILEWIRSGAESVAVLLGPPGSGKTCLLASVARHIGSTDLVSLALRADLFPHDLSFEEWGKATLGKDISFLDAVTAISARYDVLVVIDQVDALASIVDLQSNRLNDILGFARNCACLSRVKLLCSCRDFEFRYDTRIGSLNARQFVLQLPIWESVNTKLLAAGIDGTNWSVEFRELLRTPQHLSVFLSQPSSEAGTNPYESYQHMCRAYWSRIVTTESQEQLLAELVKYQIDTESLWAPIERFDTYASELQILEAAGLLVTEGDRIGFAHQTLLEFAKAQYFTSKEVSLAEFVFRNGRQNSILVRPTIWSTLNHLRTVAPDRYRMELESLYSEQCRLHVRFLLIELVCRTPDPKGFEVELIGDRLENEDERIRILIAIQGSRPWFDALKATHFPKIMRLETHRQWPMLGVITSAWSFAFSECLALLRQNWLIDPARDALTHRAIRECGTWNDATLSVVKVLIQRTPVVDGRHFWIEDVVSVISEAVPDRAPELFLEAMRRAWPARSPLKPHNTWYNLEEAVAAAPEAFLTTVWPWVVEAIERYHSDDVGSVLYKYGGYLLDLESDEDRHGAYLLGAILRAIDELCPVSASQFIAVTRGSWNSTCQAVHRLLQRGLLLCASEEPAICVQYLVGDRRRMTVGRLASDVASHSTSLISKIFRHAASEDREKLLIAIRSWSKYRDDADLGASQLEWDREARILLLDAIPEEYRCNELTAFIDAEKRQFPSWNESGYRATEGIVTTIPPITCDQLAFADEDQVVAAFAKPVPDRLRDKWREVDNGWTEPGGGESAGAELAELAKQDASRAVEIIKILVRAGCDKYLRSALSAVGDSNMDRGAKIKLLVELDEMASGNLSEEFRSAASHVLYNQAADGLPDNAVDLLVRWLAMPWDSKYSVFSESAEKDWDEGESILWARDGAILNTDRSFFTLMALTSGLLRRKIREGDRWMQILVAHLKGDVSLRTWKSFALYKLKWLTIPEIAPETARLLLVVLYSKFPDLLHSREGIVLLANVSELFNEEELRRLLTVLRESDDPYSCQGYGELVAVLSARESKHEWAKGLLDEELAALEEDNLNTKSQAIGMGLAHASTRLWGKWNLPQNALSILERLIPVCDESMGRVIMQVFWLVDRFSCDETTTRLFHALSQNPKTLVGNALDHALQHISDLLPEIRGTIAKLCLAFVDLRSNELRDLGIDSYEIGPSLVEIAMTLQRFDDTRADGLNLLESLLRAGIDAAYRILNDVDLKPGDARILQRARRRKRRQERG